MLFGKVLGSSYPVTYEGRSTDEFPNNFQTAVDEYIAFCKREKIDPQKTYTGSFNVRISRELHKKLAMYATMKNISMNRYIEQLLEKAIAMEK